MSTAVNWRFPFDVLRGAPFSGQVLLGRDTLTGGTSPLRPVCLDGRAGSCIEKQNCGSKTDDQSDAEAVEKFHVWMSCSQFPAFSFGAAASPKAKTWLRPRTISN